MSHKSCVLSLRFVDGCGLQLLFQCAEDMLGHNIGHAARVGVAETFECEDAMTAARPQKLTDH